MKLMGKVIVIFTICALCLIFCYRLTGSKYSPIAYIDNLGTYDWDQHLFLLESPITTIKEYHQFPLWNPWDGGGMVLYQHPEVPFLTPFTFLYYIFSTPRAIKLIIFLHYIIALTGMYVLGRKLFKINNLFLILIPSSIFVFNSFFALQIAEGHTWIMPFAYIPYVYYFFEKYVSDKLKADLILCSLFISIMIFEGGIYPVPLLILSLIIYSLSMFILRINKDYFLALIKVGIYSILFSSIKIVPLLDYMWEYPRHFTTTKAPSTETIPLHALYDIFLGRYQSLEIGRGGFEGQIYLWPEYGCYLGIGLLGFFLIAAIIDIITIKKHIKKIPLFICFILLFLFFFGDFYRFAPYTILRKFPIFSSTHVSSRFIIMITFIASLLSFSLSQKIEAALNKCKEKAIKKTFTSIILIFSIAILLDLFFINTKTFSEAFIYNPLNIDYYSDRFTHKNEYRFIQGLPSYGEMTRSAMYPGLRMNVATIDAYTANPPPKGFDCKKPLVFSTNVGAKISNIKFTPNKIYFDTESPYDTTIYLNQNYVRGWKFSLSKFPVQNINHKPAIELKKGNYKNVYFYYFPSSIIVGGVLTVIGIFISWVAMKYRH